MDRVENDIISILMRNPGLSDRETAEIIKGHGGSSKYVNQNCRLLESQGILVRYKREDGRIGNWLIETSYTHKVFRQNEIESIADEISEKKIKKVLSDYLAYRGWELEVPWGTSHSIGIEAKLDNHRWIIQVKGSASFHPIIVNNFLSVLGEILQRMDNPNSKYSVALPDKDQFRRLWRRLPGLAKSRMGISALFVNPEGRVVEEF